MTPEQLSTLLTVLGGTALTGLGAVLNYWFTHRRDSRRLSEVDVRTVVDAASATLIDKYDVLVARGDERYRELLEEYERYRVDLAETNRKWWEAEERYRETLLELKQAQWMVNHRDTQLTERNTQVAALEKRIIQLQQLLNEQENQLSRLKADLRRAAT